MIITVTIEQYAVSNNGTTVTAKRFVKKLREKGHTVRVITTSPCDEDDIYVLPQLDFPIFTPICRSQGMEFPRQNEECYRIIGEAVKGSDIVHCFLPFGMSQIAISYAKMYGIPHMGAFHVQPENITYTLHLNFKLINEMLYNQYRTFYNMLPHVHCPSQMIKDLIQSKGYTSELHVISNGINEFFKPINATKPDKLKDKFIVVMSGRYSREKRQDLLIRAVAHSKYKDGIHLILCGKGPLEAKYKKLTEKYLGNNVTMGFKSQSDLRDIYNYADLYVHASEIESEAISCIEAFACGLVPLISNDPLVATKAFARSDKCLFESKSYRDLCKKIEYFIDHPDEKEAMSEEYIEYAKQYELGGCVDKLESVFYRCIAEYKGEADARP